MTLTINKKRAVCPICHEKMHRFYVNEYNSVKHVNEHVSVGWLCKNCLVDTEGRKK